MRVREGAFWGGGGRGGGTWAGVGAVLRNATKLSKRQQIHNAWYDAARGGRGGVNLLCFSIRLVVVLLAAVGTSFCHMAAGHLRVF
jgi:hypothetical protein